MLTCADHTLRPRALSSVPIPEKILQVLGQGSRDTTTDVSAFVGSLHLSDDFFATIPRSALRNTDDLPVTEFVAANTTIPWSLLRDWPRNHPAFVATDYVTASSLSGSAVWDRCTHYSTQDMLQACFAMQSADTAFVKHVLDRGWSLIGPADSSDALDAWRFRLGILARIEERGELPVSLGQIRDSLTLKLADVAPQDATRNTPPP